MSSKRSFQQREEEPWLRYPDSLSGSKDYSRSSTASYPSAPQKYQPSGSLDFSRHDHFDPHSTPSMMPQQQPHRAGANSSATTPATNHKQELSMAMQMGPEDSYPSPITPSGLLPSPADLSMPSSSASSSSTLSSGHFPLFKASMTSQQNSNGSGGQKPRPSPLSLNNNFRSHAQGDGRKSPSFSFQAGSPTSAAPHDSTTAMDISDSPRAASASVATNLGASYRSSYHQGRGPMSSAASTSSSSYYSTASSPRSSTAPCSALCHHSKTNYHQHHPSCLHTQQHYGSGHHHHHPACQHHSNTQQSEPSLSHGPKPGRATKGVQRFGFPQFRPEMDESHLGSNEKLSTATKTTSTSTSRSGGYGMQRGNQDEDDDMDGMGSSYASEPPKKRLRSTASMLIDAAVETVIFTGAVALSAYQLLTGKGKQGDSRPEQSSFSSGDEDNAHDEATKVQEEDPMEEKLVFQLGTPTSESGRKPRPFSSISLGRNSRVVGYHKAKTPRPYRSRHSYSAPGNHNSGHSRSPSMPVRPNTGTEDSDEAFLRMEAQLNSLIAEGKRALNSRIEVWDEE
ncbi:hypothetical protein BGX26_011116 [Mortierella sp. AD094]|nr:hypothetical protein BGX26_011116 [Mortierella sp. AD094]